MDEELLNFDEDGITNVLPQRPRARTRLIVGIDFGTTFSGASFTLLHPSDDPSEAKISVVRNWAGDQPGDTTSNKVPTEIAYDNTGRAFWGFDIPEGLNDQTFKWLKLLLEPEIHTRRAWVDAIDPRITEAMLENLRKKAIVVASDYVRLLWEHVKDQIINEHSRATYDFAEKSVVFTVPAVWSETAKHNTYLVAVGAGLASNDLKLQTISEPEAAAVAVLKDRGALLKADDCYVVVDAGGGTVDLTSYLLTSTAPIQLQELIAGDGDVCGAVFLEMNFRSLLRTYLGQETLARLPTENVDGIIHDFQNGVRKIFDGDEKAYKVSMIGVPEGCCDKIRAGYLRLTAAELNPVFMPIMEKVERLVRRQVQQLRAMNRTPKAILLVGGFGTNKFLAKRLKQTYETNPAEADAIEVLQPNIGWESIANGAVRCEAMGIGNIVSFRIARFNLGMTYNAHFLEGRDTPEQRYVSEFDGSVMAKDLIKWYLTKGDRIKPGQEIDFKLEFMFYDTDFQPPPPAFSFVASLVQSGEENPPERKTRVTKHFVTLRFPWDLQAHPLTEYKKRSSQRGKPYRKVPVVIHMRQGPAKMEFEYSVKGEKRGSANSVDFHALMMDFSASDWEVETMYDE